MTEPLHVEEPAKHKAYESADDPRLRFIPFEAANLLEDAASAMCRAGDISTSKAAAISQAISLKRIADVLEQNLGANTSVQTGTLLGVLHSMELNGRP